LIASKIVYTGLLFWGRGEKAQRIEELKKKKPTFPPTPSTCSLSLGVESEVVCARLGKFLGGLSKV
jgi:hypothetical protein